LQPRLSVLWGPSVKNVSLEGNPFKPGELIDRPTKPAYNKFKVRALKLLKDMAK